MMSKLTYKQLFYVASGAFVLALILVFKIAIKPTVNLKNQVKDQELKVKVLEHAPQRLGRIKKELESINRQFSILSLPGTTSRDIILEEISQYCIKNRMSVYNYPESHVTKNNLFSIETNRIVIKGNFKRLLKLINYLETKSNFGRIISLTFYSKDNRKSKRKELYLELVIQNIKSDEENS